MYMNKAYLNQSQTHGGVREIICQETTHRVHHNVLAGMYYVTTGM